jgi:cysteine-rich repeat protein
MNARPQLLVGLAALSLAWSTAGCGDDGGGSGGGGGGSTGPGAESICGDNLLDEDLGEECDDGDLDDSDGCKTDCTEAFCGDGYVREGEEDCDDGNDDDADNCTNDCAPGAAGCGNGLIEAPEECDDGNAIEEDGCTTECKAPFCGDGLVQEGETCDDGNTDDTDVCTSECEANGAGCGNGTIDDGEDCDDGNASDNDTCVEGCVTAECGDGFIHDGFEECDDGNGTDDDLCSNSCIVNEQQSYDCPGVPVPLGLGEQLSFEGSTAEGESLREGSCGGSGAPELVLQIEPTSGGVLYISLAGDGTYDPVLYAKAGSCESGAELWCGDYAIGEAAEELIVEAFADEFLWVFLDGYEGTSGDFTVDVALLPNHPGDECNGVPVSMGGGEVVTVVGNTSVANNDYIGDFPCDAGEAGDVVYAITPDVDGIINAGIVAEFDAMLYSEVDCGDELSQLDCSDSGTGNETIQLPAFAGETVYLVVDGFDQEAGSYVLTLQLSPD